MKRVTAVLSIVVLLIASMAFTTLAAVPATGAEVEGDFPMMLLAIRQR